MAASTATQFTWNKQIIKAALINSVLKLAPTLQAKNPIMFTVYVGSIISTALIFEEILNKDYQGLQFTAAITVWLWITLLFANFAEAIAEGRGKAQAQSLKKTRREIMGKKLHNPNRDSEYEVVSGASLKINDYVLVESGDFIPSDGVVIAGIATVNESAVTGESAPVIREAGGDRDSVTGGTQVISDWLIIKITVEPGQTFLDRMISLIEGAKRHKTPNELALTILLAGLTLVFLVVCATLLPFSIYSVQAIGSGTVVSITVLIALFVCLAPTTIGGLLSAIGIAGMDRMIQANIIALSSQVVETAGDIDTLILDKTGTITLGNRQATEFIPLTGVSIDEFSDAAQLASLADETPEGRSIVILAKEKYGLRGRTISDIGATFIPFTAQTRMSGANLPGRQIRKGAATAIQEYVTQQGGTFPKEASDVVDTISRQGSTALVVAEGNRVLGIVNLKDIVKGGIKERFGQLRRMGIRTVMVTGDNQLTAAAIAAEAGVDDFIAEATPEAKLKLIRKLQAEGHLVAMTGDGTNDAPALAQADVALAMNSGTQAAKEAGNLIDLDSSPTKLIEVVEIGKQLLMTRGSLTTFSLANDVSKNFAIIPAAFTSTYPALDALNIMHLSTPNSAILSAVIFNAIIIVLLIPLALHGVKYKKVPAELILRNNILIYGIGGIILPFIGIKLIDLLLVTLNIAQTM
jgi:K+-transporting ATPase ATPase B chain